ncbi:MAG: hypothetical protein C4329_03585 [Chitinophagaceae bacterium]
MSHQQERKDKNCLNCGAEVLGRFCYVCGQENIIPHQNFWSLTKHFVFDIFHFDGKFFDTVKYLLFKPGYVAKEYVTGKRMSYLDPIRMYLFTSAIFFLIFFKFINPGPKVNLNNGDRPLSSIERIHYIDSLQNNLKKDKDSLTYKKLEALKDTTRPISVGDLELLEAPAFINPKSNYHSVEEYEAAQSKLPEGKRDGLFKRTAIKKSIRLNKKYEGNESDILKEFFETFLHRLPIMLFFSLPFFALVLKMLYSRRKNFFYSDHAVFTLYQYIFSFILILFIFGFAALKDWSHWGIFGWFVAAGIIYGGYYLLRSMKLFYEQSWGKTATKFLLLNFLGGIVLLPLFIGFLFFSFVEF